MSTWLFTIVTAGRRPLLTRPTALAVLRDLFARETKREGCELLALVILPDHVHCVLRLQHARGRIGFNMRRLKALACERLRRLHPELPDPLWHQGFHARPLPDESAVENCLATLHEDPVEHELAAAPEDWPWTHGCRPAASGRSAASCGTGRGRWGTATPPAAVLQRRASQPLLWR